MKGGFILRLMKKNFGFTVQDTNLGYLCFDSLERKIFEKVLILV